MDLRFRSREFQLEVLAFVLRPHYLCFLEVSLLALEQWPSGSKACCTIVRIHITTQESHRCLWLYLWWSDSISLVCRNAHPHIAAHMLTQTHTCTPQNKKGKEISVMYWLPKKLILITRNATVLGTNDQKICFFSPFLSVSVDAAVDHEEKKNLLSIALIW